MVALPKNSAILRRHSCSQSTDGRRFENATDGNRRRHLGIDEICKIIHDNGCLVYMDGANMNAQVALTSPGKIGADFFHLNHHNTFCDFGTSGETYLKKGIWV